MVVIKVIDIQLKIEKKPFFWSIISPVEESVVYTLGTKLWVL